jgi:hypothetical protein
MDWRVVGRPVRRVGVDGRLRTFKQRGREGRARADGVSRCVSGYLPGSWAAREGCRQAVQLLMPAEGGAADNGGHSTLRRWDFAGDVCVVVVVVAGA